MQDLLELMNIATPSKLKNIKTLGQSNTLVDKLYWLLNEGVVETDNDALENLYPNKKSKVGLYQVKEKLYNKLLDSIIIIDPSNKNISPYSIIYNDCLKYTAAFEKIALKGGRKATIKLGDKILKLALPYNMCEIIVRVSRVLTRKAVFVLRDEKKMNYYRELHIKYSLIEDLEDLAKYYWGKVSLRTSQKRMIVGQNLIEEVQKYIKELESNLVPDHTALTIASIHSLKVRIEELNHNHKKVIALVDEYVLNLKSYNDVHSTYFTSALNRKLAALITLRNFTSAQNVAKETLNYTREGTGSWFTALENIIILYFYQSQYAEALRVYKLVIKSKGLKFLPNDRQEIFKVYRAYMQFFINVGLLPIDDVGENYRTYRASKFANEVPIFTNDKTGINITIIVAQFLLLFTEEKYQKAIDKIESIKQYTHAHLRKDVTYRSNCFLKMLVKLVECNFHKEATIRKTKILYEKLKNQPSNMQRMTNHVEIVPYEILWNIIVEGLDNNQRGKFKRRASAGF